MKRPSISPMYNRCSGRAAMHCVVGLAVLGLIVPGGRSQSAPEFDVASVKPQDPGGGPTRLNCGRPRKTRLYEHHRSRPDSGSLRTQDLSALAWTGRALH